MEMDDFGGTKASQQQKAMYFGLMRKLGYDGDTAKAMIKEKLKLDSFANVTKAELTEIIEKLKKKEKYDI